MKKTLIFLLVLFLSCTGDEGNPCVYQPTLTTGAVTNITDTSATLNGTIDVTSENSETPNNIEQGFVYSTEIQPTIEDIQVNVNGTNISTTLEDLTPNTTYYVRSFMINNFGEFYGNEVIFSTTECDGVPYASIVYGTQEWAVENACQITYRDGTPIPEVTDDEEWSNLTTGAWCYYDNDPTKPRLYNWYAVKGIYDEASLNNPSLRKEFAPEGWRVPSDAEWTTLENYLITNGYNYDGTTTENKIAKSMASTTGWNSITFTGAPGNDQSLNNSSGFYAFPEGYRSTGTFAGEGLLTQFWCSNQNPISPNNAYYRYLTYNESSLTRSGHPIWAGYSVRLVKD